MPIPVARRCLTAVAGLLLASVTTAVAQEYRATLTGRITDEQSAALPGVIVVATHVETGTRSETVTDGSGLYTFPLLSPGDYSVAAELTGFARILRDRVPLGAGQRVSVDLTMKVGSFAETITVEADRTLLQTANASLGLSVEASQIESLPLSGRAPSSLVKLAGGVADLTNPQANTRPFDNAGTSNFAIGGGQVRTSDLLLDGGPNMARDRRISYNPPADIVQEVTVETFQSDAAFGNSQSGTVNIVTKSGTNDFRGSAGFYTQPSGIAGTNYFTKLAGGTDPPYRYNQGGFTVGGPVVIPRAFNGRNKAFWILSYDNIRNRYPGPTLTTVPTEAMRSGDFSALLPLGDIYRIYDPLTGVAVGQRRQRQAFPNNIIPADRINQIALEYLKYYPLPNLPGEADGTGNYLSSNVRTDTYHSIMGRGDVNISQNGRLMIKWYGNDRVERKGNLFDNIGTGAILPRLNSGAMADYVHTLSNSVVVNTRFGWTRFADHEYRESTGYDIASLGFPPPVVSASLQPVLPLVTFGDSTTSLGPTGGNRAGAGFDEIFDSYQWFTSANMQKGRHAIKFGADVRFLREVAMNYGNSAGSYTFGTQWTRGPLDNSAAASHGQALASFLLGLPTAGSFDVETRSDARSSSASFFFQDDWRASSELTLNLGLRYEVEAGTWENDNGIVVGFDPDAVNQVTAAARAAYAANPHPDLPASQFNPTGGLIFASDDRRDVYDTPKNQISPRLGFAYTPARFGRSTVLRGGFGVYYHNYGITGINRPGFAQTTSLVPTNDGFLRPYATFANPFPDGILQPVGNARGVNQNLGQAVSFYNPDTRASYSRRYTIGVQQRLPAGMVLEFSYQYNQARGLPASDSLNFVPAEFLSTSPQRDQAVINRLTANVANPFAGLLPGTTLNGSTIQLQQLLLQHPQFTGATIQGANIGYSNQHIAAATVQKRFSAGVQLLATYTRSQMKEATSRLNPSDTDLFYGISNEDRPSRLVLSGVYALPFGSDGGPGASAPGWARAIIANWTVSGHYTYQAGAIASFGNVIYLGGDLNWDARNIEQAFDVTRFNRNPAEQLSMNIRTLTPDFFGVRTDGINTLNLALFKDVPFGGQRALQLRAESFNAFDYVQFSGPQLNPTNANFGRITSQANSPRTFQFAVRFKW